MQVLSGFSIGKYMPDIIVIEVRGFDLATPENFDEYNLLVDSGYRLRSILFHSLIFEKTDGLYTDLGIICNSTLRLYILVIS